MYPQNGRPSQVKSLRLAMSKHIGPMHSMFYMDNVMHTQGIKHFTSGSIARQLYSLQETVPDQCHQNSDHSLTDFGFH